MVSGAFGLPGSGKTMLCAWIAMQALKGKSLHLCGLSLQQTKTKSYKKIYTNFPMRGCYQFNFDDLGKYDFSNSLVIIDEIMMFADSRNYKSFGENLKFFFSQHRRMHIDVFYASQAYDDVDKKIRSLTSQLFYIRKCFCFCCVAPIQAYFRVEHGAIHQGYELGMFLQRNYFYLPRLYKLTDSYQLIVGHIPEQLPDSLPWCSDQAVAVADQKRKTFQLRKILNKSRTRLEIGWNCIRKAVRKIAKK